MFKESTCPLCILKDICVLTYHPNDWTTCKKFVSHIFYQNHQNNYMVSKIVIMSLYKSNLMLNLAFTYHIHSLYLFLILFSLSSTLQ